MPIERINLAVCALSAIVAVAIAMRERRRLALLSRSYWRFLGARWKLVTFAIAASGMALVAPLTGDPTWDWVDALAMALLTFATAPFAVGAIYRAIRGKTPLAHLAVAAFVWMLSASWSYDFYILARDGFYPRSWSSNIVASSVLYASAGLFWNLEHREGRGVVFGFMQDDWPAPPRAGSFRKVALYAVVAMLFVTAVLAPFLWNAIRESAR